MDTHMKKYYKEILIMKMKSWRNNNEINGLFGKDENILFFYHTQRLWSLILNGISCKHQNVNVVAVRNVVSV